MGTAICVLCRRRELHTEQQITEVIHCYCKCVMLPRQFQLHKSILSLRLTELTLCQLMRWARNESSTCDMCLYSTLGGKRGPKLPQSSTPLFTHTDTTPTSTQHSEHVYMLYTSLSMNCLCVCVCVYLIALIV